MIYSDASYLIAELGADVSHRLGHKNSITTFKYYAHMFPDKDIVIASKMELSMNIKLAEKLHFEFNNNQNISANRVISMQKYTKRSKRPLKHQYKRNISYSKGING